MRIFFIPGFGEEPDIFEKIHPHLPGDKVLINNWTLIGDIPRYQLTSMEYARELVQEFHISSQDVVIGHSMGGWIAVHIKQLVNCTVIQIASWTRPEKVVRPISNTGLVFWFVRQGLYFNPLVKKLLLKTAYAKKPSKEIFSLVFDRLSRGNVHAVLNQLRIILNTDAKELKVAPDLRIHARADNIIRFPDEPAVEVPGDHFTLYTHPEKVYQPIEVFLEERIKKAKN